MQLDPKQISALILAIAAVGLAFAEHGIGSIIAIVVAATLLGGC